MDGRMKGKVAIVTGGGSGFGEGICKRYALEGAKVVVNDVNGQQGQRVADEIAAAGGTARFIRADVATAADVNAMVKETIAHFGRLDTMVNNAGITHRNGPMLDVEEEEFDRIFAVNVKAIYLAAKAVVPIMRAQRYGRIVNISSGTPFKGTPNMLHYVTSKGAILALTRALAREVGGDGICVNTLAPGLVISEGVIQNQALRDKLTAPVLASRAIKRDQTPEDLIQPMLFLASDDCAFMTGETVVVDGGSVMH